MHEGYLFTLGICGSAAASSFAPTLLNAMLAGLPPVKRAALFGEVVPLDPQGRLYDPLLEPLLHEMRDAELLLFVTPLWSARVPTRLRTLLERAAPLAVSGDLRRKVALLVGIEAHASLAQPAALDRLCCFCTGAGMLISDTILVTDGQAAAQGTSERLTLAAQRAYARARQQVPHALP